MNFAGSVYKGEALVIGGGLAGASLAILLARAGRDVLLIERSKAAHPKVCGEFLSHEALHYLARVGIDVDQLGAVPIEHVRLVGRTNMVSAQLPFVARSLSRACLDEALLQRAVAARARVLRGRQVQDLSLAGTRWNASTDHGETITGDAGFLATGKHDLRGWRRPPGLQNELIAFKMYWRLAPRQQADLAKHVELVVFPGGYAGLQPVEDAMANLCLLVTRAAYRTAGGSWPHLLHHIKHHAAHLARRLNGATAVWQRPLSLSSIPYGLVRTNSSDGLWRLGDQSAVIPSFAGDGMSIALHSAAVAAEMYQAGGESCAYQQRLSRAIGKQVGLATRLSRSLVRMPGLVTAAASIWPQVLRPIAASTRIREKDMLA